MINSLSVAVTNFQPLNDGKKWLAKVQAGDYPEGEMSTKLDEYIKDNPVHYSDSRLHIVSRQSRDAEGRLCVCMHGSVVSTLAWSQRTILHAVEYLRTIMI